MFIWLYIRAARDAKNSEQSRLFRQLGGHRFYDDLCQSDLVEPYDFELVAQTLLKHSSSRAGISNRQLRRNADQTNYVTGSHVSISKLARICQHGQMWDELTELLDPERLFLSLSTKHYPLF
jgi:hypothetical protein